MIAVVAVAGITLHLVFRFAMPSYPVLGTGIELHTVPLLMTLLLGGVPLVVELLVNLINREFGSDLLAGISIVTSVLLGEYLAGSSSS